MSAVAGLDEELLDLDNLHSHPAVALRVVHRSSSSIGGGGSSDGTSPGDSSVGAKVAADVGGNVGDGGGGQCLTIYDDQKPMGNGAFGAVFAGDLLLDDGHQTRVPVAVKKFFFLENPTLCVLFLYCLLLLPAILAIACRL